MSEGANYTSFKGVMLCNRPPQISNPEPHIDEGLKKMLIRPAFISTIHIASEVGARQIREERPVAQPSKSKSTGVVQEHKKWLQQLAQDKQRTKEDEAERLRKKEELRQRLADKVQSQRTSIRAIKESDVSDEEKQRLIVAVITKDASSRSKVESNDDEYIVPNGPTISNAQRDAVATPRKWVRRARSNKPQWAMTIAESDEHMDEEAEELLAFTANLDYDDYVDNLEIKESARYMQKRVKDEIVDKEREDKIKEALQRKADARSKGVVGDDDDLYEWVEVDDRGLTAEEALLANRRELFHKYNHNSKSNDMTMDAREKGWNAAVRNGADTPISSADVKKSNPEMATIHSDASLRQIVTQVDKKQQKNDTFAIQPPKMIVIHPVDGTDITQETLSKDKSQQQQNNKTRASNLPYLYRNPAI